MKNKYLNKISKCIAFALTLSILYQFPTIASASERKTTQTAIKVIKDSKTTARVFNDKVFPYLFQIRENVMYLMEDFNAVYYESGYEASYSDGYLVDSVEMIDYFDYLPTIKGLSSSDVASLNKMCAYGESFLEYYDKASESLENGKKETADEYYEKACDYLDLFDKYGKSFAKKYKTYWDTYVE